MGRTPLNQQEPGETGRTLLNQQQPGGRDGQSARPELTSPKNARPAKTEPPPQTRQHALQKPQTGREQNNASCTLAVMPRFVSSQAEKAKNKANYTLALIPKTTNTLKTRQKNRHLPAPSLPFRKKKLQIRARIPISRHPATSSRGKCILCPNLILISPARNICPKQTVKLRSSRINFLPSRHRRNHMKLPRS